MVEVCPSTADTEFCALLPHVARQRIFAAAPVPSPIRRIPLVTPYLHALQGLATLRRTDRLNRQIAAAIDADRFDVVLAQDCRIAMNPYVLRHLRTRSVFFCHHGFTHWTPPPDSAPSRRAALKARYYAPARRLFARALRRDEIRNARSARRVLTASQFAQQQVRAHYGVDAVVAGAGVDVSVFTPGAAEKGDYVLAVGELSPQKDPLFLIEALGRLDPGRRPALVIAANATEPALADSVQRRAATLGVRVQITASGDDRALAALYAGARVFVYAPRAEMLGLACLEAMSCGTPVVAVGDGGVPETVLTGMTGWLTEREPQAFAERVAALLADPALCRRMGAAAAAHVRSAWTWSAMGDRVEAALSAEVSHRA